MPKPEKAKTLEGGSLGFGHFSTAETENDWRTYHYDGLESTSELEGMNPKLLKEINPKLLKRIKTGLE